MAAYGATFSLLRALFKLQDVRSLDPLAEAVFTLYFFLEENREVKRDYEIQIREAVYEAQDIICSINPLDNLSPSEVDIRLHSIAEDHLDMVANRIISLAKMTTEEFHHQTLDRQIPSSVWKSFDEIDSMGRLTFPTVGRNEDIKQLWGRLMSGSEGLEVIPIVGIPGIGKTHLAHWLLDDPSTRDQFDATGLVRISANYDKRETLLDLLESLTERAGGARVEEFKKRRYKWSEALHQKTSDQLVRLLQNSLKYKRYLILLDDIRDVAIWHDLKELFPDYYNRSRILITARNFDASPFCCHELDFINDEDSFALLLIMVFGNEPFPRVLIGIAEYIAQNSRGFPRAVVTVAKLLRFANPIEEYWGMVRYSISTCGSRLGDLMEALLLLTYNHLPQRLKVMLLYMAIFPYSISRYTSYAYNFERVRISLGVYEGYCFTTRSFNPQIEDLRLPRPQVGS